MKITTQVLAEGTFYTIKTPIKELTTLGNPGMARPESLRLSASEIKAKATRLLRRAALLEDAADFDEEKA